MQGVRGKAFRADRAWGAVEIACTDGVSTRLRWTDRPYCRHVNDGEEVLAVLGGQDKMHDRERGDERRVMLQPRG